MTDPIDPIDPADRPRSPGRRAYDRDRRAAPKDAGAALPVPVEPARRHAPPSPPPADAAFNAQLYGGGPRRGLKGGSETLENARATYLGAEYSGPNDRRPKAGLIRKTEI